MNDLSKNPYLEKINSSFLVEIPSLDFRIEFKNPYANCWRALSLMLVGIADLRSRIGTFTTPWGAPSNSLYAAPKFKFINDRLDDLLNIRALEVFKKAKDQKKKIAVFWSGGIDSTLVLTAFLKNISLADQKNIIVVCNTNSILENFNFYSKYISNKLECLHYNQLEVNSDFLDKHILLHGDPGDCLFGPSSPMYRYFINRGEHLQPWRNHLDRMAELLEPVKAHGIHAPGFGRWYVDKITRNLEESGQADYVSTIADWWWWTYYNFKWEFSCQRPFFFLRKNLQSSFKQDSLKFYAENVFYNDEKLQQWSYSNLKKHASADWAQHKQEAKKYIHDFDKNLTYYQYKSKTDARPSNYELRSNTQTPFYYDQNWVGYNYEQNNLETISTILLEKYKG